MALSIALNNALTGLNVNQQQMGVLSQNIANANTIGYSKQVARQESIYINGQGNGVSISEISRKVDEYLNNAVQKQGSAVAASSIIEDYSTRMQLLIGNPGSFNSVDAYINTFFNSVQSLVQTPQNTTLQQTMVNNAFTLADQISTLAEGLRDLQFEAEQDVSKSVESVNGDLKRLFSLNNLIASNISLGKNVADLEDQRDRLISNIGENINLSTFRQPNGSINAITGSGITVLDSTLYQISYKPVSSAVAFTDGSSLSPMTISRVNEFGDPISPPITLTTAAPSGSVTSVFTSGKIAGLLEMRDRQLPSIIAQLDTMAAALRDHFNAIHNAGSGYPGANSFTGSRAVFADQVNQWAGTARIAVLDSNGQAAPSIYADETNGIKPLVLNLEGLDTLSGVGNPSVQGIINSINSYYGTPQNKLALGNLNNIQLTSRSTTLPSSPPKFTFDFNLDSLANEKSDFFVTGVTVRDNNGVDITSTSNTLPSFDLSTTDTYVTSAGSRFVTINTQGAHNISEGQLVYLSTPPGGPYDGIPASNLGGYFRVVKAQGNSFQIMAQTSAVSGQTIGVTGQTAKPPYSEVQPGDTTRTFSKGTISADLTANTSAPFYTISVAMGVTDSQGVVRTSVADYRIDNQQTGALNKVFGAVTQAGSGTVTTPTSLNPLVVARLVDENGKEIPKISGQYTNSVPGYLQLSAGNSLYNIAIDSLDSREMGNPTVSPVIPGSNRGFSHYFGLNDFFVANKPINTGDTIAASAINMKVDERLRVNPSLFSLGQIIKAPDPADPRERRNYTYQINPGDNSTVTKLSQLSTTNVNFVAAGGLGATLNTFSGYSGQIIGASATNASTAQNNKSNAEALMEGFQENASAISGVNLDVELANTVIYQNAYTASARVITVTNELFDVLLNSFQ